MRNAVICAFWENRAAHFDLYGMKLVIVKYIFYIHADLVTCMVQEQFVAEATGVDPLKKMTGGGIRVVRANKPQNVAPVAVKTVEIEPGKEDCFNKYLVEAEGDVELSASLIASGLKQGEVKAAIAVPALVEYMGVMGFMKSELSLVIVECLDVNTGEAVGPKLAALRALGEVAKDCGKQVEPYLMHALPSTLKCFENKDAKVRSGAEKTALIMMEKMNAHATRGIVDILFKFMDRAMKWQVRAGALKCLGYRAKQFPTEMGHCMLDIMPLLSESVVDTRTEVAEESSRALLACCYTAGNRDLEPHVPAVVSCIKRPGEVSDLVAKLSATTFVQTMEDACLAVLVPIMDRALKERSAKTQRRAAIIIENMSKLVLDPADARPFLPVLIPALETVSAQAADPELRDVAGRACLALKKIKEQGDTTTKVAGEAASKEQVLEQLNSIAAAKQFKSTPEYILSACLSYVASLCTSLIRSHIRGTRSWDSCCVDYLMPVSDNEDENKDISKQLRKWAMTHMGEIVEEEEEFDDELCNCEFSLAYGGRILLTNTILRLRRGRRYGLCGANGAGKSTLMKAIANEQLDGFPPKEELRTVYVAHDMDASVSETPVADFMFEDPVVQEAKSPSREQVVSVLTEVGFSPELQASPIASLSGGWKMKLALARAMLIGADILLLDEPTNHLDTTNVAWLINYLTTRTDISSMIVSHDSGFLDAVCTDIIHYENRKLVHYLGNLSEFVKVKPEAKSYYELSAAAFKFKFPEPGFLDGVKGKRQPVIRVSNMSFTYPGAKKPQLQDVTARLAMGSRVAVIGRNGAGKSTLIKLLTGETLPTTGTVWKHPNLRIAYVAQHAFHHIEEHLDKTPAQYLWWRFVRSVFCFFLFRIVFQIYFLGKISNTVCDMTSCREMVRTERQKKRQQGSSPKKS
jgi:elongation factor 3